MSIPILADPASPACLDRATQLAAKYGLRFDAEHGTSAPLAPSDRASTVGNASTELSLALVVTPDRLELRIGGDRRMRPIVVEFAEGAAAKHRLATASRSQPLARAVGVRGEAPFVVDATAGLGRDAFVLAGLGCHVMALERSPAACALLEDGLLRALRSARAGIRRAAERIELRHADARDALPTIATPPPDVVYLDPMYADLSRTALARKEMRVFREFVGDDNDAIELFGVACTVALRRVVVKRHPRAAPLGPAPDFTCKGKIARFDVYLTRGKP